MRYGPWRAVYSCVECGEEMSDGDRMYSDGACPFCGVISGVTIVACRRRTGRYAYRSFLGWLFGVGGAWEWRKE